MNDQPWIEWVLRGAVGAVTAAVVGLFARLRTLEVKRAAADEKIEALEGRKTGTDENVLAAMIKDLELSISRQYLSREDWVPTISRIERSLERQNVLLARIEERQRQ